MVFFGMSFISTKVALTRYGPITIIFFRLVISSLVLILFDFLFRKEPVFPKGHLKFFLLLAFFQPLLYFLAENFGLKQVPASIAAIIIGTIPVITPIFSRIFVKERLTLIAFFGLILSFIGVTMIVGSGRASGEFRWIGIILLFGAVGADVGYVITLKKAPSRYSSLTIVKTQNILGAFMFFPLFLLFEGKACLATPFQFTVFAHIIFLAVFPSSLAYIFLSNGVRRIGVNRTNIFANTIPIFTAVFSFFILDERFTIVKITGIGVVLTGVLLAQIRRRRSLYTDRSSVY